VLNNESSAEAEEPEAVLDGIEHHLPAPSLR